MLPQPRPRLVVQDVRHGAIALPVEIEGQHLLPRKINGALHPRRLPSLLRWWLKGEVDHSDGILAVRAAKRKCVQVADRGVYTADLLRQQTAWVVCYTLIVVRHDYLEKLDVNQHDGR